MTRPVSYVTHRALIPTKEELFEGLERLVHRAQIALSMFPHHKDLCEDMRAILQQVAESRRPPPPACSKCQAPGLRIGDAVVCSESCWNRARRRGKKVEEV